MDNFEKAMHYLFMAMFCTIGGVIAICMMKIIIEVVGVMLGSTTGTIVLGLIAWHYYKKVYVNNQK